jgi:hypothetical protein
MLKKEKMKIVVSIAGIAISIFVLMKLTILKPKTGIDAVSKDSIVLLKCSNEKCGSVYGKPEIDYVKFSKNNFTMNGVNPMDCDKCEAKSCFRALKCSACNEVFFYGQVKDDFPDRCPHCENSDTENARKANN